LFVIESGQEKILDAYVCCWTKGEGREGEVQYGREIEDDVALLPPQVFVKRILRITSGVFLASHFFKPQARINIRAQSENTISGI
jgi:hypothetical protein